ncbi:uncharacterized protein LOC114162465 [Vigna unguiculata]|uniref:Uncharacterized protein n=1 Tax=Vigna unguiculata TaxID=3917 RepID=A0A4D6NQX1_VIGUN|nr:uncharacterized protein LOC114162465 [Vigna unguiculata]QCE15778.1 hypothetical protein DEO72_LG11g2790 [Vigna unguiculata]
MNNITNNAYREEKSFCYFHPRQLLLGVCPLCLNERLLLLAAKQGRHHHRHRHRHHHHHHHCSSSSKSSHRLPHAKPPSSIHKIFAFGSLFTRHESHHWKSHNHDYDNDYDDVSPSPEESFISIKFEENGVASWEKSRVSKKVSLEKCNRKVSWKKENKEKSVIEHAKSREAFRWRKRIGHMFQLIRWKKSGGVCHVEGVKVRKGGGGGWMRTLTKRKTTIE